MACLVPGGLLMSYLFLIKLFGGDIGHRPLLFLSVMLILMGVQLIGMGVLGELLVRIYHEPEGRRQYILRAGPRLRKLPKSDGEKLDEKSSPDEKLKKKAAPKKAAASKTAKKSTAKKTTAKKL